MEIPFKGEEEEGLVEAVGEPWYMSDLRFTEGVARVVEDTRAHLVQTIPTALGWRSEVSGVINFFGFLRQYLILESCEVTSEEAGSGVKSRWQRNCAAELGPLDLNRFWSKPRQPTTSGWIATEVPHSPKQILRLIAPLSQVAI